MNMDSKENALLQSQTMGYIQAVAEIFYTVLQKRCPLDKELKHYFRRHDGCGSRDRYHISESCFSLFRWYGWLRHRMPGGVPVRPYASNKFCHGLAAALWLERHDDFPFFARLLEYSNIDPKFMTLAPDDIKVKKEGLGHFFKIRKLNVFQLIPEWLAQVIPVDTDLESLIESLQRRPPVWIRTQNNAQARVKNQLTKENISFDEHPRCLNAIKITTPKFNAGTFASYQSGDFEIQDLASQCIGLVCQAQAGEMWWDVCAGSGGKSLLLADEMKGKGKVVVTDISNKILKQLNKRVKRAQYKNINIADLGDVCASQELFDGVLVDAPCSCTGIWRRNPDLKWTTTVGDCQAGAKAQFDICEMAAKKVKIGGVLVYATCSLSVQENEELVETFLKQDNNFQLEGFIHPLNGEPVQGMLRINFQPFDNDGMFVARFRVCK